MRPSSDIKKPVEWRQYIGLLRRGFPETLILEELPSRCTSARAPGPGPLLRKVWKPLAERYVKGRKIVLQTDSAKAYTLQVDGCVHTRVVHQKKKDKHGKWLLPRYTMPQTVTLPNGKILDVVGGTQYIDGLWKHIRSGLG